MRNLTKVSRSAAENARLGTGRKTSWERYSRSRFCVASNLIKAGHWKVEWRYSSVMVRAASLSKTVQGRRMMQLEFQHARGKFRRFSEIISQMNAATSNVKTIKKKAEDSELSSRLRRRITITPVSTMIISETLAAQFCANQERFLRIASSQSSRVRV